MPAKVRLGSFLKDYSLNRQLKCLPSMFFRIKTIRRNAEKRPALLREKKKANAFDELWWYANKELL